LLREKMSLACEVLQLQQLACSFIAFVKWLLQQKRVCADVARSSGGG
jgi:hypothetical protein